MCQCEGEGGVRGRRWLVCWWEGEGGECAGGRVRMVSVLVGIRGDGCARGGVGRGGVYVGGRVTVVKVLVGW